MSLRAIILSLSLWIILSTAIPAQTVGDLTFPTATPSLVSIPTLPATFGAADSGPFADKRGILKGLQNALGKDDKTKTTHKETTKTTSHETNSKASSTKASAAASSSACPTGKSGKRDDKSNYYFIAAKDAASYAKHLSSMKVFAAKPENKCNNEILWSSNPIRSDATTYFARLDDNGVKEVKKTTGIQISRAPSSQVYSTVWAGSQSKLLKKDVEDALDGASACQISSSLSSSSASPSSSIPGRGSSKSLRADRIGNSLACAEGRFLGFSGMTKDTAVEWMRNNKINKPGGEGGVDAWGEGLNITPELSVAIEYAVVRYLEKIKREKIPESDEARRKEIAPVVVAVFINFEDFANNVDRVVFGNYNTYFKKREAREALAKELSKDRPKPLQSQAEYVTIAPLSIPKESPNPDMMCIPPAFQDRLAFEVADVQNWYISPRDGRKRGSLEEFQQYNKNQDYFSLLEEWDQHYEVPNRFFYKSEFNNYDGGVKKKYA